MHYHNNPSPTVLDINTLQPYDDNRLEDQWENFFIINKPKHLSIISVIGIVQK